jgi:hypothetical protein
MLAAETLAVEVRYDGGDPNSELDGEPVFIGVQRA